MTLQGHRWGVGLRRAHFDDWLALGARQAWPEALHFAEVVSENVMGFGGRPARVVEHVAQHVPVLAHGVALSVGAQEPFDGLYLERLHALLERVAVPVFSDHLCFSSGQGHHYHELLPLPFTEEAVAHVRQRLQRLRQALGPSVPFLLENPSYYFQPPGAEMDEASFIRRILADSEVGLLLDVNNVYVNACNHGYDPYAFIDALPLHRVRQVHVAGHDASGDFIVDTHGAAPPAAVLALLRYTLTRIPSSYITLEWDHQLPQWQALLATLAAMQAAMQDATPAAPAAEAPAPTAPLVHAVTGQAGPVDLRSYQRQVQHLLGQQRPPAALARIWQQDEARLAFYPQASRVARRQVLDKIYPALADVLPAASWEALCHAYMQAGLLTSYELNDFGRHLPAFLAADAVLDDLDLGPWSRAFLAELAALLWAELSCYFAAPTPGADWPAQLNPTLQVRECQFAVARWLKAWRRDDMDACRALAAPQPETVLVWRRPSDALVVTEAADSMLLLAIKLSWQPELIPAALAEVAHRDLWQAAQARAQQCGLWLAPGARCTGIESVPVLNAGGGNQDALVARAAATVRPAPGCSTSMSPHPV